MKQPCAKDCPDRSGDCHAKCDRWAVWERERNKGYAIASQRKQLESDMREVERRRKRNLATGKMFRKK